jgi:outer membrane biosynthesis protein TonB
VERALNGESPAGLASGDELVQGRPESEAEDNVQAVENAEKRLQEKESAPKKKDAPSKRPREERRTEERKAVSDTESEDPGPQKKRIPKKSKPKTEPQVVDDSDDSEDHRRASSSRHKPVTSSAIYNAYDGAILNDVRRRFQTLIYVRDGSPVKTLTIHRHLNYRLTLKAAKDTMETVLYRQFKNAMEIAYKDTSKE